VPGIVFVRDYIPAPRKITEKNRSYSDLEPVEERRRDTLYTHVDVYTRRVLDSCLRIRERGETEQTRGSPVPRGLGVLSYLDRAARRQDGGERGGVHGRGALPPRSSSRLPFSLAASPFESRPPARSPHLRPLPRDANAAPHPSLSLSLSLFLRVGVPHI